jgi:hypothetical protein
MDVTLTAPLNNLDFAGQYDLREMQLILSGDLQAIDIRNLYTEFNIYEDMIGTAVSGNITIMDNLNMLSRVGFSGNERIRLTVESATLGNPLSMEFLVYGISPVFTDPAQNSKRGVMYVINFCSPEKLRDLQLIVAKAYKSTPISTIVGDILGSSFLNTNKKRFIEETSGHQDLIIPSFKPFAAIDWLSTRAVSGSNNPDYVFFENHEGYYFSSLESLFNAAPSTLETFIMDPRGFNDPDTGMPDIGRRLRTIKDFSLVSSPDSLQQTKDGTFASVLCTYDPIRMIFKEINYSILDGFNKMKGPGGYGTPPYLPNFDGANKPTSARYFYPTNYNRTQTAYGKNDPTDNNTLVENFMGKRQSILSGMQTYKVRVMINGNLGVMAGSVINLAVPDFDRKTSVDLGTQNDVYSGRYLVTALRHRFDMTTHDTFIEAVKGSPEKGLGRV